MRIGKRFRISHFTDIHVRSFTEESGNYKKKLLVLEELCNKDSTHADFSEDLLKFCNHAYAFLSFSSIYAERTHHGGAECLVNLYLKP